MGSFQWLDGIKRDWRCQLPNWAANCFQLTHCSLHEHAQWSRLSPLVPTKFLWPIPIYPLISPLFPSYTYKLISSHHHYHHHPLHPSPFSYLPFFFIPPPNIFLSSCPLSFHTHAFCYLISISSIPISHTSHADTHKAIPLNPLLSLSLFIPIFYTLQLSPSLLHLIYLWNHYTH